MRFFIIVLTVLTGLLYSCGSPDPDTDPSGRQAKADTLSQLTDTVHVKYDSFGFAYDSSLVSDHEVQPNESLYLILDKLDFSPPQIYSITRMAEEVFDVRSFRPGQSYRVYASADSSKPVSRLVWQPNAVDYVVFDWRDSLTVYKDQKEITTELASVSGEINSSLYETLVEEGASPMLVYKLSEVYAWEIDFFGLRAGDRFEMVYEQKYIDGEFYSEGEILAAEFTHRGESFRAYKFENDEISGYFDENGNSMQKALLKAPFKYNHRISSGYSRNRFHPVLKRRIPHYGVDYAAPYGTPVLSVGDGTVTEARYRGASGNIVKVRHNGTYETAYLHLKGFARGIRSGAEVKQGQVIGYVGNTGRVTGTHLDYRIYKNGRPVNPLRIDLPASRAVPESSMEEFAQVRDYFDDRWVRDEAEVETVRQPVTADR